MESTSISGNLLGFIHFLRDAKFDVSIEEAILAGQVLSNQPYTSIDTTRAALRSLCCQTPHQWRQFDTLFFDYWYKEEADIDLEYLEENNPFTNKIGITGISTGSDEEIELEDDGSGAGAGRQTSLTKADFRFLKNPNAMRRIEILADRLARQIRPKPGRRQEVTRKHGRLAIAPTLRASIKTAGEPMIPWHSKRRLEPPAIVVLHDVSHSMTFNNPLLFRFTRGLIRRFTRSQAFVFHTRLYCVTPILKENSIQRVQTLLEKNNRLWLGGTCIADSLKEFRETFAKRVLGRDSVVLIISDGCDSNEPDRLMEELSNLRRRSRRLIWLHPMLEREGFNAEKESVINLRRHVDDLLPAHSLDALRRCVTSIGR